MNCIVISLLCVFCATTSFAASAEQSQSGSSILQRWNSGDERPDGIAFYTTLTSLAMYEKSSHARAVGIVRSQAKINNDHDAEQLLSSLLGAYTDIEEENAADTKRLLCPTTKSVPSGDKLYMAYDALDNIRQAIANRHLEILRVELSQGQRESFEVLFENTKNTASVAIYDHKKRYKNNENRAAMIREEICQRYASAN